MPEALDLIPIFISWHKADEDFGLLEFNVVNAQAAWLRYLNGTAFASLKKYAAHFFNFAFGETEPKKVPYETTGINVEGDMHYSTWHSVQPCI